MQQNTNFNSKERTGPGLGPFLCVFVLPYLILVQLWLTSIYVSRLLIYMKKFYSIECILFVNIHIQCESQKRKPRFNLKSLKNQKTDHKL